MRRNIIRTKLKKTWLIPIVLFCLATFGLWQYAQQQGDLQDPNLEPIASITLPTVNSTAIDEPIQPLPVNVNLNPEKVKLGEKLFNEPRLSRNNSISCASCHKLQLGGTDQMTISLGIYGRPGTVNTPTVFNSGFNFKQFWDGRAETLFEQIDGPIHSSKEMDSNWPEIANKLKQLPEYVAMFKATYSGHLNSDTIKDAIATFERSLITPNSRFDRFLRGDKAALSIQEKEGYRRFKAYGCITCHQGINVGGNMFQGFGVFGNYFHDRGSETKADLGRYNVTGDERDRYVFKVPSLRNVSLTAPYFHDGSAQTLTEAVEIMGKYQLGRPLSEEDVDFIVRFLTTLTGKYRGEPL